MKNSEEIQNAVTRLKKLLPPASTVYTNLRHVSNSGMMRHIKVFIAIKNKGEKPRIYDISWLVAQALELKRADNGGLKVGGCGMDMGFHIVYSLGRKLYPKGFKLRKGQWGRNGDKSGFDKDGGYSLNHEWV